MTRNYEVVTLSCYHDIFAQFYASLNWFEPDVRCTVVTSGSLEVSLPRSPRYNVVGGVDPFVFARNANIGIAAAGRADVVLVNDDVQFTRRGGLDDLARMARDNPDVGILSPVVQGVVGNPLQRKVCWSRGGTGLVRLADPYLAFVCVYIKRAVLDAVGPLDESYTEYGGDDRDYSLRAHAAGFQLAVTTDVLVVHGFGRARSSSSFARAVGDTDSAMRRMDERFRGRHGA